MNIKKELAKRVEKLVNTFADKTDYAYYGAKSLEPQEGDVALEVPCYRQFHSYTCGFVAGLSILHTFHPRKSATNFYYLVNPHPNEGTPTPRLRRGLKASGVGTRLKRNPKFEDFKRAIDSGAPVLTCLKRERGIEHWVVVYGYSKNSELYVAGNHWFTAQLMPWADFRKKLGSDKELIACWGER